VRLSVLFEGFEPHRSLLEDGEGMSAGALGDANAASAVGPTGAAVPGINTTADVAMYPKYLGFSYRGGTVKLKNRTRKRKSLHEEALNKDLGAILEEYSTRLAKVPQLEQIEED
jgi:hypothetical protein